MMHSWGRHLSGVAYAVGVALSMPILRAEGAQPVGVRRSGSRVASSLDRFPPCA